MAEVLVINPTKTVVKINELKRVGAYIRVSSDSDDQENSFMTQYDHYMNLISNNPEWTLVDMYKDDGITGTEMEHRDDFNRMYQDCVDGKLDLILTKSISRFARNIVDSIKYIRELKALGVSIYFEKENIDTSEMTSEMMVALYSVFAQAESESISNNVKLGKRFNYKAGRVPMMYGTLLGYRKGEDGNPEIIPEEAKIIEIIFTKFLEGYSYQGIAEYLMENIIKLQLMMKTD